MNNVGKFLSGRKKSFLTQLRAAHEFLGPPSGSRKWAPLWLKSRGSPGDSWVQVPSGPLRVDEITAVLEQTVPLEEPPEVISEFGYRSREELISDRLNMFAFFLGALIGDCSKPAKGQSRFPSMAVALTLSQSKSNSLRFGEYTSLCARTSLGLSMHRIRDAKPSSHRYTKSGCYRWISESSPLLAWVFRDCLGLKAGETTTSNPLRMDWLVEAPASFKVHLIQGVSESDGWVDTGNDSHCLVSSPNTSLFANVLSTLNVRTHLNVRPPVEVLSFPADEAAKLELFSPRVRSAYFERLQVMSRANRLPARKPIPEEVVLLIRELASDCETYNDVCYKLAKEHKVKVSSATVKKYITSLGSSKSVGNQ